jgi:3-oxoacyl-[acyl-carrier protein] reductase
LGRIDILVNNAGGLIKRIPIAEISEDLFERVVALNQRSALMCTKAAVAQMRNSGARHGGAAGAVLYAGTKGFISTITRGFAKELVKDKIRVNAVSPGVINTPFHERFSTPEMLEGFKATIPMNRLGEADECAGAFLFLASEQMSGYITGQIIEVNGGQYMP